MKMDYDTDNPVAYGMTERGIAFFSRGHLFEINPDSAATLSPDLLPKVVARFADEPLLLSGYVERDEIIRGKPAVLDVPYGEGRIILFGFSFHNRAQAHTTFKLFFNSMYY
ncbi:hypothetical protein AMJ80_10790 [bacterium SM23_31]|nr:MAG: hypothetical protein AMJ80_10790 [bacterium SM23_31]